MAPPGTRTAATELPTGNDDLPRQDNAAVVCAAPALVVSCGPEHKYGIRGCSRLPWQTRHMAVLETLAGGALAMAGGALVSWLDRLARRYERKAARRDLLNREASDAAAHAELVCGWVDPQPLTLFVGQLEQGEQDHDAREIVHEANKARASLTRVAVGHDDPEVSERSRMVRDALTRAANRSLRLRASVRTDHQHDREDRERAEKSHEEAVAAVKALQSAIRASMDSV